MNMKIVDFTHEYINEANELAVICYNEERCYVPALPEISAVPDLSMFIDNGLGVAAFDGNKMTGFLCCYGPFDNAFGISGIRGVFSPMGGNAAIADNQAKIYAAMYQAAGEKWVRAGVVSHAISLYTHDTATQELFFRYGFGLRCIDAIREIDVIEMNEIAGFKFSLLRSDEIIELLPLENLHMQGYLDSPFFMYRALQNEDEYVSEFDHESIYVIARYNKKMVAYMMVEHSGETFIQDTPGYIHVNGAYCLPEFRGKGISKYLLFKLMQILKEQGYTRLGVDFESFNPTGSGFWLKHFSAYTHSVVRRIDENILGKK